MTNAPSSKTKFSHLTDDLGLSQMKCNIECVLPKTIGNDGDDDVSGKSYDTVKYYEFYICLCIYQIPYNLAHFKMR